MKPGYLSFQGYRTFTGFAHSLSLRVHPEVPQTGARWGGGFASAGTDPGDLQESRRGDSEGSCATGSCPLVAEHAADNGSEPSDAGHQGQDVASPAAGFQDAAEEVMEPTLLGSGLLRCHKRGRDRRCAEAVHRAARSGAPGRRQLQSDRIGNGLASPARSSCDFSRWPNPSPSGEGRSVGCVAIAKQSSPHVPKSV